MEPLAIECDPGLGAYGSAYLTDDRGPAYSFVADAFPDCVSPAFWHGLGEAHDDGVVRYDYEITATSDGTAVTVLAAIELAFSPVGYTIATLGVDMLANGLFHVPPSDAPGAGLAPGKLRFEVEHLGVLADFGATWGRVSGPGVDLTETFDATEDGVHELDVWLEPGATYEVEIGANGLQETDATGSRRISFSVLAPEPGAPLLLLAGAAALGLRSVLDAHRVRARCGGVVGDA